MSAIDKRLVICGEHEIDAFKEFGITHVISISNPGITASIPDWFEGDRMDLQFGDVISEADAASLGTRAPDTDDIRQAIDFFSRAWSSGSTRILIHCNYGASRSPALAFVGIAHQLGMGREDESLRAILKIRPEAIPNLLVVEIADTILERNGALVSSLRNYYREVEAELNL